MEVFDGDQDHQNIVKALWKIHLPIVISFKMDILFFTIDVSEKNFGHILFR